MNAKLNKRERRAAALLAHYTTCERLALACGMQPSKVDGKRISVALLKLESIAHAAAYHYCSTPGKFRACWPKVGTLNLGVEEYDFNANEEHTELFKARCADLVRNAVGSVPPGFFVNFDARGYALKIDPDNAEGRALIESVRLHTDLGRNGILSPEITGD